MEIEQISGEILELPYLGDHNNIPMIISLTMKETIDKNINIWSVTVIKTNLIKYCVKNKNKLKIGSKINMEGRSVRLNERWNYFEVDNIREP